MVVKDHGYPSVCRLSVINAPNSRTCSRSTARTGVALSRFGLKLGGKSGYMKYRNGGRPIRRSRQSTRRSAHRPPSSRPAPESLEQAQARAIQDLQRPGSS